MALQLEHVIAHGTGNSVVCASPTNETGLYTAVGRALLVTDSSDPRKVACFRAHDAPITALDVSFDGSHVATGQDACPVAPGHDAPVVIWKAPGMTQLYHLLGITRCVKAIAFSPDGYLLAACGGDNSVCIWDIRTSETVYLKKQGLLGNADDITFLAWGPVERPPGSTKPAYSLVFTLQDKIFLATLLFDHGVLQYRVTLHAAVFPAVGFQRLYVCGAFANGLLTMGTSSGELVVFSTSPAGGGGPVFKVAVPAATGGVLALVAAAAPGGGGTVVYCGGGDGTIRALASGPGPMTTASWKVRATTRGGHP